MVDRAAHHHLDDGVLVGLFEQPRAHQFAVAEHRVAVGDAVYLVELVADEQHGLAVFLQQLDQDEQVLDLLVGERRGRLVHDHHIGIDRHGARHPDQVLVGDAEVLQPMVGVDMRGAHVVEHLAGLAAHLAPVDGLEAGARGVSQKDVLGHRQFVEQHRLLVNGGDAGAEGGVSGAEMDRHALDGDLALVRLVDAGQDLHQRRLAGAVLADQRGDLAGIERQRHVMQGPDTGEALADPLEGQQRLGLGQNGAGLGWGRDFEHGSGDPGYG